MFKLVSIMNKEEYLAWCKNCQKRSFDWDNGVTCSLTNEIASFKDLCNQFEFDSNEFKKNVINDIQNMVESESDYFLKPTKIKWNKYPSKSSLPIELIIRNGNFIFFLIGLIVFDLLLIGIVFFEEIKDFHLTKNEINSILKLLAFMIPSTFLSLMLIMTKILDKSPKLILNDKGLIVEESNLFYWDSTEFNVLYSQNDGESTYSKYLVISPFNKPIKKYLINSLEYSPKKILHLIALFKDK